MASLSLIGNLFGKFHGPLPTYRSKSPRGPVRSGLPELPVASPGCHHVHLELATVRGQACEHPRPALAMTGKGSHRTSLMSFAWVHTWMHTQLQKALKAFFKDDRLIHHFSHPIKHHHTGCNTFIVEAVNDECSPVWVGPHQDASLSKWLVFLSSLTSLYKDTVFYILRACFGYSTQCLLMRLSSFTLLRQKIQFYC